MCKCLLCSPIMLFLNILKLVWPSCAVQLIQISFTAQSAFSPVYLDSLLQNFYQANQGTEEVVKSIFCVALELQSFVGLLYQLYVSPTFTNGSSVIVQSRSVLATLHHVEQPFGSDRHFSFCSEGWLRLAMFIANVLREEARANSAHTHWHRALSGHALFDFWIWARIPLHS